MLQAPRQFEAAATTLVALAAGFEHEHEHARSERARKLSHRQEAAATEMSRPARTRHAECSRLHKVPIMAPRKR
jgi:hypothetical protein